MRWFKGMRAASKLKKEAAQVPPALYTHLSDFVQSRRGVEAWVEAPTGMNQPSILLVAGDGEWTRRVMPSAGVAHEFASLHGIPSYDAGVMPYPQRMRDYDARRRPARKRLDLA